MQVKEWFDKDTNTLTYLVYDPWTKDAVILDPVLNFDAASGRIWHDSLQSYAQFIDEHQLKLHYILETHIHADHLTGAQWLKQRYPGTWTGVGAGVLEVQKTFRRLLHEPESQTDDACFDRLWKDHERFHAGSLKFQVVPTPGHTPSCVSYCVADVVFTGDALFMPDSGTGRCDFPGGSAKTLFQSIQRGLYTLSDFTKTYPGHDYQPCRRALSFNSTIKEQKHENLHLKSMTTENEFVSFRESRDKTLAAPKLLWPSLQVNMHGGKLPDPASTGGVFLKIPLFVQES